MDDRGPAPPPVNPARFPPSGVQLRSLRARFARGVTAGSMGRSFGLSMKPRDGLAVIGNSTVTILTGSPASGTRQRFILTDTFVWNGISVLVSFEPDWLGLAAAGMDEPYAHLELQVLSPKGAPLPVSDTGYWSEFLSIGEAEEEGGAVALAVSLLDEFANTQTWRVRWAKWEQGDLFA